MVEGRTGIWINRWRQGRREMGKEERKRGMGRDIHVMPSRITEVTKNSLWATGSL